ncbi:copper-binding protein [Hirschia litorea]|uniref:Copper-binding protein n=1 Tax=Hirschia litorea TaxID=1199156 RepID=A0ABW2IHA8_9PROT
MKHLYSSLVLSFTLVVSACGEAGQQHDQTKTPPEQEQSSPQEHTHSEHTSSTGHANLGHATGKVESIGPNGDFIVIDHSPIPEIGMGAMTMGFDIQGEVDLSNFTSGNNVSFMVKKGRDNSYRITDICNTETQGDDCLTASMKH